MGREKEKTERNLGRSWLPLLLEISLLGLTGQMLADVVQRKSATAGSLDGWGVAGVEGFTCLLV